MFGRSLNSKLKALDIYKTLPKDLTEPTLSGAIVSLASIAIMVLLFFSELDSYLKLKTTDELNVDNTPGHNKLRVNIDMILHRLPCDVLSLDVMDVMGNHEVHVGGDLMRNKIDKNGAAISANISVVTNHENFEHDSEVNFENLKEAFEREEGCHLLGFIVINKVPGNFHISTHAFGRITRRIFTETRFGTIDVSHTINHLSFGDEKDIKIIKQKFGQTGEINPLDGLVERKDSSLINVGVFYHYYLSVVPTTFVDVEKKQYQIHQFTVHSNRFQTGSLPAIYFRYDLSPVYFTVTQENNNFWHFLVQICAIIGGVFTVAGIIDSIVHRSVKTILKKAEMGKLY